MNSPTLDEEVNALTEGVIDQDEQIQMLTKALQRIADYDKKPRLSYFERTMTMIARSALEVI